MSSNLAQFSSTDAARDAYYGDDGAPSENGDGSRGSEENGNDGEWTDWSMIQQAGNWWIYGREAIPRDNVQFHITGQTQDGSQVYLTLNGEVVDSMEILETMDDVNAALQAWAQNVEEGNVPPGQQPTGTNPGAGTASNGWTGTGGTGGFMGTGISTTMLIIGVVAAIAAYYYYVGYMDGELDFNLGEDPELPEPDGGSA